MTHRDGDAVECASVCVICFIVKPCNLLFQVAAQLNLIFAQANQVTLGLQQTLTRPAPVRFR